MSTHCGIAVKTEEGYKTIYCHHDGYESYMYPMLTKNYNTEERAKDLVSLGDASCIEERMVPSRESGHSFDNPEDGVCIFYHRDRGECWREVAPSLFRTKSELLDNYYYSYIFEDGKWNAYKGGRINHAVEKLEN